MLRYKIIGADQKEYGPVTADEVRKWLVEGRANAQTLVQVDGGAWKPLASFAEFASDVPSSPAPPPALSLGAAPVIRPGSDEEAARAVSAPAVCLIVAAILGMLNSAVGVVLNLAGVTLTGFGLPKDPQFAEFERAMQLFGGTLGVLGGLISLAVGGFILWGAFRMMKLRSYGLAIAISVVSMIPCVSPCCCLGLPFGVWALVVLARADVKAAFH
jgi:hypothetical protein